MRSLALVGAVAALAGCARTDQQPAAGTASPPAITLADVAGKWSMRTMPQNSDSVLITYEMTATADTAGWVTTLPGRPPIPVRVVAVAGDSVITEMGPYESALRKGVNVSVRAVNRLRDGKLVGTFVARYATSGPDSLLMGRAEGTRLP